MPKKETPQTIKEDTKTKTVTTEKEDKNKKAQKSKKTIVELVENNIKNKKYTADIIASALIQKNLFNTYEEDNDSYNKGLKIPKRLTEEEFEKIIEENLNRKI